MADRHLLGAALEGLGRGDLQPLAEFLKSPLPFDGDQEKGYLRHKLVECIEGRALWKLEMKKERYSRLADERQEVAADFSDLVVHPYVGFVEKLIAAGETPERAIHEATKKFKISRTAIYEAKPGGYGKRAVQKSPKTAGRDPC